MAKTDDPHLSQIDRIQQQVDALGRAAEVGALGGLIAHEVRNLLTPAIAYTQLALTGDDDAGATRRALERSLTAMRRACEVSELIIAATRPDATASPTSDVARVVADCIESLGWDVGSRGFSFEREIEPGCTAAIAPDALRHIILNLLLNARVALPEAGGTIAIRADRSTWNTQGRVELHVHDNGKGIEAARLARIQESLASVGPTRQTPSGGLGLILCRQLLAASGGQLTIASAPTQGTTAIVSLRIAA